MAARPEGDSLWGMAGTLALGVLATLLVTVGILGGFILGALVLVGVILLPVVMAVGAPIGWALERRKAPAAPREAVAAGTAAPALAPLWAPAQPVAGLSAVDSSRLQGVDILAAFSEEELAALAAVSHLREVPEGATLAVQGERGQSVYMVLEGHVQLTTASPAGEMTVRIAGPGESLPLAALLGTGVLITSAKAMSRLMVVELAPDAVQQLFDERPEIGMKVYRSIAENLGHRYERTLTRLVGTFGRTLREAEVLANL